METTKMILQEVTEQLMTQTITITRTHQMNFQNHGGTKLLNFVIFIDFVNVCIRIVIIATHNGQLLH